MESRGRDHVTVVDAHVHLHDCFDLPSFFEAAASNLRAALRETSPEPDWTGVLCLAQGADEDGFGRLKRVARSEEGGGVVGRWRVTETAEEESLLLRSGGEEKLVVICGFQIQTEERLEILALGTTRRFADGDPLEELLPGIVEEGAIPIVPWGFGKWTGERRGVVRSLVDASESPALFLGDSANRPVFLRRSRLFDEAEAGGVDDLPGSDPFPFPSESGRVGRAGFVLPNPLDPAAPTADLKRALDRQAKPRRFLRCESPLRFLRNQVLIQSRKAGPSSPAGI